MPFDANGRFVPEEDSVEKRAGLLSLVTACLFSQHVQELNRKRIAVVC